MRFQPRGVPQRSRRKISVRPTSRIRSCLPKHYPKVSHIAGIIDSGIVPQRTIAARVPRLHHKDPMKRNPDITRDLAAMMAFGIKAGGKAVTAATHEAGTRLKTAWPGRSPARDWRAPSACWTGCRGSPGTVSAPFGPLRAPRGAWLGQSTPGGLTDA